MERHVQHELSAYIDGEARCPNRIAAHLDRCDVCRREYDALVKLSASLKTLPYPDVRPEFVTRVVAHVREAEVAPMRYAQSWALFGVALTAVLAIMGGVWILQTPGGGSGTGWSQRGSESQPWPVVVGDEEWMDADWAGADDMAMTEWSTESIEAVPADVWSTPLIEAWGPGEDLDSLLLGLDEEAGADFCALLWLYAQETGAT